MSLLISVLIVIATLISLLAWILITIYGIYLCFCKKWYIGIAALLVPGFATIVGWFKFFKKDILQ